MVHYRHQLPVVFFGDHCLKNFAGPLLQGERMRRTAHSFPQGIFHNTYQLPACLPSSCCVCPVRSCILPCHSLLLTYPHSSPACLLIYGLPTVSVLSAWRPCILPCHSLLLTLNPVLAHPTPASFVCIWVPLPVTLTSASSLS